MEGRCAVETWADFGFSGTPRTSKVRFGFGSELFLCHGSDEVYVFSRPTRERKLKAVLQFAGPVSDLVESHDGQLLYVSCRAGVYCVRLQLLLSRSPADESSGPAELHISSECLVVADVGVLSLLLVGSVLLTLSKRDSAWVLTLYSAPKQASSSICEVLSSFSLPLLSGVAHNDTEGKTGETRRPVLICVRSGDTAPPPSSSTTTTTTSDISLTDGCLCLDPLLFQLLFGIDSALAKSLVVLCGLPDGCLCFLPLRLPGSRLRVLHSLEQPVVYVGVSVVEETGPSRHHPAQGLVAVGELGRVVLMKTDKGAPEGEGNVACFVERCVPGPVMCGCMDKSSFYYSTGSDLLVLDLSDGSSGRGGQEGHGETSSKADAALLHSPTSLNVCRVVALAEPTRHNSAGSQLLGLSDRGQLQMITVPVWREDATLSKLPSIQVGRSVKDLLSAIGDVCERASTLKTAIKCKNQTLRHLNQVLNISFLLKAGSNTEGHPPIQEKTIRCHATASWSRLLQKDSLNLTCVLDNSSPYVLERGWTLRLSVFPLSFSPDAGGESSSSQFSFPFHSLHPGERLEVSLPLAAAGSASFPRTVSCSLDFSLPSLLGEEAASRPALQSSCISLPLNTLTVDWLHALQLNSPTATLVNKSTCQWDSVTADPIQAFLSSRQIRCREGAGGESAPKPEREQYSACVRLSSELLRDTLVLKSSALDPLGPPHSVCLSLVEWLFSEGLGGVKSGHHGDKLALSNPVVQARGPNGHTVKLTAKEVTVGEESVGKEECLSTVELQVESSSIAAVCGLHHALLCRVQTLLQRAPERAAATKRLQSLGLRQALQRAEHLLQQIQQSRISGAFGVGVSTGQMTRSLLNCYLELRKNPLLIM